MTPLEQHLQCRDAGALPTLPGLEKVSPMAVATVGSVGGLLMLVNARDKLLKVAGGLLFGASLFYGVANRPSKAAEAQAAADAAATLSSQELASRVAGGTATDAEIAEGISRDKGVPVASITPAEILAFKNQMASIRKGGA